VASRVEAMGGAVSASSTLGVGTTFSIRLPDAARPAPEGAGRGPGGEGEPSGHSDQVSDLEQISGRRGG
jgi:hypothetical protein